MNFEMTGKLSISKDTENFTLTVRQNMKSQAGYEEDCYLM